MLEKAQKCPIRGKNACVLNRLRKNIRLTQSAINTRLAALFVLS